MGHVGQVDRGQRNRRLGIALSLAGAGESLALDRAVTLGAGAEQLVELKRSVPVVVDALVSGSTLGHLTEAPRAGMEYRSERMPCVADRVSAVENREELVRRPQAMMITDPSAYLTEAHGAQDASAMLHT